MNIRQCANCGRLFQSFGSSVCLDCAEEKDKAYILVRDYIYAHPESTILEITQNTGVREKWILEFLKEERLSLGTPSAFLTCEHCGKKISSGRICESCKDRFHKEFSRVIPEKATEIKREIPKDNTARREGRMHVVVKKNY